jgi:hypothetical protein
MRAMSSHDIDYITSHRLFYPMNIYSRSRSTYTRTDKVASVKELKERVSFFVHAQFQL